MVDCLQKLQCLEITDCKSMQEIISMEGIIKEEHGSRAAISFPQLNSLILQGLQKLTGFCHGDYIVEFQSLKILEIKQCPELKGFIINKDIAADSIGEVLFNEKVAVPNLEILIISHLRNVKRIWFNQFHGGSFCKLEGLIVDHCDELLNILSSSLLGVFQRLEMLIIIDCDSVEEVFELHGSDSREASVVTIPLRVLYIYRLPKLKHVWSKDPCGICSFPNLREVRARECWSLKSLFPFSIGKGLVHLETLEVDGCGVEEIVSKNIEGLHQENLFEFNHLSYLELGNLQNLKCFYPEVHTTVWPVLKRLKTYNCEKIKIFGQGESQIQQSLFLIEKVIPQLEEVLFSSDDVAMICDTQFADDFFGHIKVLEISYHHNESAVFPFRFLQRFYNLEMLVLSGHFKELSPDEGEVGQQNDMIWMVHPNIKKLKLHGVCKITHLWKQDSQLDHICASLETLEVWDCNSLINLTSASSSFQNLTTLDVWHCKGMTELIASSKAQSLVCLVTMRIKECEMMTEIVASGGDEATYEIIFKELKCLELDCLISLKSFCSGNYTFRFPSLEGVIVSRCPKLKSFCQGALCTPKLQRVYYPIETDHKGCWAGDLNATIEQLHEKKVGYHGLKELKFSVLPELMDIWSRNPQETLDFKNLEILEVCDSNNMRCIFSISTALSLERLQHMEIKRCNKLKQVIREEEEATTDDKIVIIFPLLKSIFIESCPDLTSFYLGSPALECPSLKEIKVAYCPKMTSFVSSLSRDKDKEAIIGDGTERNKDDLDTPTAFFSDKIVFPKLKNLKLSSINIEKIWQCQLPRGSCSFQNLTSIVIEGCDNLKHVLSYCMVDCLPKLQCLEITDCKSMQEIISVEGIIKEKHGSRAAISFTRLNSLILKGLQNVIGFCHGDYIVEFQSLNTLEIDHCPEFKGFIINKSMGKDISIGTTDKVLFNEKIAFPELQNLKLSLISIERIWQRQLPRGSCSFQNLTSIVIEGCNNLKHVLSYCMVDCLQKLQCLKITDCKSMQEIISVEGIIKEKHGSRAAISFPRLNSLILQGLQKLIGFYQGDDIVKFQSLNTLKIDHCPEFKGFIINKSMGKDTGTGSTDKVLFNEKVVFPNLEKMTISRLKNVKRIWYNQLHEDSFCKLKELKVKYCDGLLNIFSSFLLGVFQRLEMVTVTSCDSLEALFDLHGLDIKEASVVAIQLKKLCIFSSPKLKYVWNKDPCGTFSFQNLQVVEVQKCWSLKSLFPFSIAKDLSHLESLVVIECGVEKIVSKNIEGLQQEICFRFNHLSFLMLAILPYLKCFYPGEHTTVWPMLKKLRIHRCRKIKILGHRESQTDQPLFLIEKVIPQLEEVYFSSDDIATISDGQFAANFFGHIKVLRISSYLNESAISSFCFLQRFCNLEQLELVAFNFKELYPYEAEVGEEKDVNLRLRLPKIKKLTLNKVYKITHLWKRDSLMGHIRSSLETLEVLNCDSLINLASTPSYFQNLTTLVVCGCKRMTELIVSSKAQSLVCLVTMSIRECDTMTEIVASRGDEATYEIIFRELKCLELHCLQSLTSFCSGNHTFKFPSLGQVSVGRCPRLKSFCQGAGVFNAAMEHFHGKTVGYHGLKELKFSEFPELMDIWGRNPQKMLDFKNLEFLEICDTNNLRCIFSISMAFSLRRLQQMEIRRCNKMEQVIMEEEEATTDDKIVIIFPLLKSIFIESCPDLTSFYLGSPALECPSLKEIKVASCPKIYTLLSALSRDKAKESIIGDGAERSKDDPDTPPAFFSDKVVFPMLKKLHLRDLWNLKKIWHDQVAADSFGKLEELLVQRCHKLLHVFPFNVSEKLHRLKDLEIRECDSVEEVFEPQRMNVDESYVVATTQSNVVEVETTTKFVFHRLRYLKLYRLPNLKSFYHKMHTAEWPSLKKMFARGCDKVEIFASTYQNFQSKIGQSQLEIQIQPPLFLVDKVAFPCLEELRLGRNDAMKAIWHGRFLGEFFQRLKVLELIHFPHQAAALLYRFIQLFPNLEKLLVSDASFNHIFQCEGLGGDENHALALTCLSELRLFNLPELSDIWYEELQPGQAFYNLRVLKVQKCGKLKILVPSLVSFQNLTRLVISKCNGLINLLTHSTAKSLEQLTKMKIMDCQMVEEIIACTSDEVKDDIIFTKLKYLGLICLPNLANFCSGNYAIDFPSLEEVVLEQCPKMMVFSQGELSTPKLQGVKFTKGDDKGHWEGNLNATIKQYFQEINDDENHHQHQQTAQHDPSSST